MSLDLLLQAAKAEPESDLPRLVLADWLEENGDPLRAEFIRVQCQLAGWVPDLARRTALQEREKALRASHSLAWMGPFHGSENSLCSDWHFKRGLAHVTVATRTFLSARFKKATRNHHWNWVEGVRLEQGKALLAQAAHARHLGSIASLDLSRNDLVSSFADPLLRSEFLTSLVSLDLSNDCLDDTTVRVLKDAGLLSRVKFLDLRNNPLSVQAAGEALELREAGWVDVTGHRRGTNTFGRGWTGERPGRLLNSIGMDLARIPAGTFLMGSPSREPDFQPHEGPLHPVTLTRPFWLSVFPVTQAHYQRVMGYNPAHFQETGEIAPHRPVENVSWYDAIDFCARLSALPQEQSSGRIYRLPTEAEWEYACRAGTTTAYWFGKTASSRHCNFDGRSFGRDEGPYLRVSTPVGSYPANPFGLHDMTGNVWEWCSDRYSATYYRRSPQQDPQGPSRGAQRIIRGGCWNGAGVACRSARRLEEEPETHDFVTGFRVALTLTGGGMVT